MSHAYIGNWDMFFNVIIISEIIFIKGVICFVTIRMFKCGSLDASQKEVSMTGTGLSKMFDIQNNQFLVV